MLFGLSDIYGDIELHTSYDRENFAPNMSSSSYPYPTKWGQYNMFYIMLMLFIAPNMYITNIAVDVA
jgi:hypothetical protein